MTRERAEELLRLDRWSNGGCLAVGAVRPAIEPMTAEERDEVHQLWRTMPGYTSFNDALYRIAKGEAGGVA